MRPSKLKLIKLLINIKLLKFKPIKISKASLWDPHHFCLIYQDQSKFLKLHLKIRRRFWKRKILWWLLSIILCQIQRSQWGPFRLTQRYNKIFPNNQAISTVSSKVESTAMVWTRILEPSAMQQAFWKLLRRKTCYFMRTVSQICQMLLARLVGILFPVWYVVNHVKVIGMVHPQWEARGSWRKRFQAIKITLNQVRNWISIKLKMIIQGVISSSMIHRWVNKLKWLNLLLEVKSL